MALGKGIGIMGRGADIDPETLATRQKMAQQLYANSLAPKEPERSWTQGAARLAQSLMSGYEQGQIDQEKESYKQQQAEGMAALLNGDGNMTAETLSKLTPQQQNFALDMMYRQRMHNLEREEKGTDRQADYEMKTKLMQEDPNNYMELKQKEAMEAMEDPDAPEEVRRGAKASLDAMGTGKDKALSMTPEDKEISQGMGKDFGESKKDAQSAQLQNTRMDAIIANLEDAQPGALFNVRHGLGTVLEYLGADPEYLKNINLGDPRAMSVVKSNLLQFAIDEQVRQKGPQTENDFKRYQEAFAQPTETNAQILRILKMRRALNDRSVQYQNSKSEWYKKYGSIGATSQGKDFEETWRAYVDTNPLFADEEQ